MYAGKILALVSQIASPFLWIFRIGMARCLLCRRHENQTFKRKMMKRGDLQKKIPPLAERIFLGLISKSRSLALTSLAAGLFFVNNINASLAANDLAVLITLLGGFKGVTDSHFNLF